MADKALYSLLVDLKANTAQLQQDMDKAVGILQRSGRLMNNVTQGLAQGFGQAFGRELIQNISRLSGALTTLADKGEEAGSIADSFRKLGGSASAIEDARKAVRGMVSEFDLMKVANEGIIRGLPDLNKNFSLLADYAGRFANATGQDTLQVLQRLTTAIGSGANKALREFGIEIDQSGTRSQKMAQAIAQLSQNMGNFDEVTDSVSNAHKGFSVAMDDALKQVGIGINENAELTKAYRQLEEAINAIDWVEIGQNIASMAASIMAVLPSLKSAADFVNNMALGLEVFLNKTNRAKMVNLQQQEQAVQAQIAEMQAEASKQGTNGGGILGGWMDSMAKQNEIAIQQAREQLDKIRAELGPLQKEFVEGMKPVTSSGGANAPALTTKFDTARVSSGKKANKEIADDRAKKELEALQKADKERSQQAGELLREQYQAQRQQSEQSAQAWGNALSSVFSSLNLDPQISDSLANLGSQIASGFFSDLEDNQGGAFGIGQTIADGFSDALAGILGTSGSSTGGMTTQQAHDLGIQGPGMADGSWTGSGNYMLGDGMTTEQAHAQGIQGPGSADGSFNGATQGQDWGGWAQAAIAVAQTAAAADKKDRGAKDNRAWGEAAGAAIGAVIAGWFTFGLAAPLGAAIGGAIGGFAGKFIGRGSQNEETRSRHAFANWIEDGLKEMGGFDVRQKDGSFVNMTNFIEGDKKRFNEPGWGGDLQKQSKQTQSTFSGLGMAFKELLGITEEVGDQLGFIFGENLAFDIDNARHFVKRLGLSFEEVEEKLVSIGLKGEKTWLEIETGLQGASEAFKPGLVAVGDYNKAMQNLLNSGGRGFEAVQSIRDIFVEASEVGIKTFEQLQAALLKTYDPAIVDAFFAAANQRGVTSIEAGINLTDRNAGGMVADMQAAGVKFKEVGDQIQNAMGGLNSATTSNTTATEQNTNALLQNMGKQPYSEPEDDLDTDIAAASGAMVFGPTRALMGEAGPEAILPLSRKNGRMGVSLHGISGGGGGYVVNIDARGAAPGVERRIQLALRETEDRVSRGVMRSLSSQGRRST